MARPKKKIRVFLKRKDPNTNVPISFEFELDIPDNNGVNIEYAVNCNPINIDDNVRSILQKAGIEENDVLSVQINDPRFT